MAITVGQLAFVGFNNRVVALQQDTGELVWNWSSSKGKGYVSLMLCDERRLIVSVNGYTYCLDPMTGKQLWFNELKGYGVGVVSLAAIGGRSATHPTIPAAADEEASHAAEASHVTE
jgi:outer membrane protein assembly factor BamB